MPRTQFGGPFASPLAVRFEAADTHQASSPFLNLTPEIRNIIYDMVLTPEEPIAIAANPSSLPHDKSLPYIIKRKISLALLRTCRQVYLETHLYPLQTNIHYDSVFPCRYNSRDERSRYPFRQLKVWQKSTVTEIYLTVDLCHDCFKQGPYLKALLSRTGMSPTLRKLHLHWVTEQLYRRTSCPRAKYWKSMDTRNSTWSLTNFVQLKEITIQLEVAPNNSQGIDMNAQVELAKTWSFKLGGDRLLKVENTEPTAPECLKSIMFPQSTTRALRWVEPEK
jgi:hypothetical protein